MNPFPQQGENIRRTILLVEDDPANAEMLALLLQTENHDILSFRDGEDVLANLDTIKEKRPALFLFDYQLSGMTALDLYERLHAIEGLERVPAIIVTALTLAEAEKERLHRLGLLFIPKPYSIDDLLLALEQATS